MINLPCNVASMSQVAPCQNVPVQTSQYNFPTCQQRQTSTQQMQTTACGPCFGTSQGPFTHVYQPDTYVVTHQCAAQPITNPCHPVFQSPCNPQPSHPSCGQLPQNILDQIRSCVSNTAPIFILPGNCQQSPAPQQQQQPILPPTAATGLPPPTAAAYPPSGLTYPTAYYPPPPPVYPYPVPVPFYDPSVRARDVTQSCGCCRRRDVDSTEVRSLARTVGCRFDSDLDEHYCVPTPDDTVCSKRNCPSSLHLQALASQFLSMQGIIACAATRLILRKVPGSNVTTTMEDTMAKAQKAINVLTKDQLLSESRNAQQVNALINLHMTANPPPNIIPILTLVQLKMNLLKAQVEGLINQKMMEIQGVGVEVATDLIDPTVLALKSDAELRDFLSILRQKECDERVNVNFAPYRSQRAIAETRLSNIQNKIRQVEAEFDRRRCAMFPAPTLTSRIVQQFAKPCYSARFEDPRKLYSTLPPDIPRSPDPFVYVKPRSPKRLFLKPCTSKPETKSTQVTLPVPPTSTRAPTKGNPSKTTTDDGDANPTKEGSDLQRSPSTEDCTCCDRTTSDESVDEAKKKLRPRTVEINASNVEKPSSSLMKLTSNVCVRYGANARKCDERSDMETPCDAKCWMAKAYINVGDDESLRTLTGSESDTITLNEKIDAEDVCGSRDAIEIRSFGQIMDRQEFASAADLRQFEEQAKTAIAISRKNEAIKEYDIGTKQGLQDVSSPKAEQTEIKTITITEVTDDEPISSAQKTERKSPNDYTSSLEITLKSKRDLHEDEQKDKNDKILSAIETMEQSVNQVPIKSKKKTRFHIASLMTNIIYNNEDCEYRSKRKIDKKITTREMSTTTDPDIGKFDKYNSIENLRNAIAHDITGKDHSQNMFLGRLKHFSKLCVDRQCQTVSEEEKTTSASLRANLFPPFKNLHKYMAEKERNGNDVGVYPSPITKAGITARKHLSRWNGVAKNTLETRYKDNQRSSLECEESFVSEIFSVIANRLVTFVNKIITLNGRYTNRGAILRKTSNIDVLQRDVPIYSHPELILKDHDPLVNILHRSFDSNQETPDTNKRDFRDANLLRISTGKGYGRMHKIRHSIIQDKENGTRCLLISTSNRDLTLIRDLGRPYEVQRSLLIRSRLKDGSNTQDHPQPYSLLKRTGKDVSQKFHQARYNENVGIIEERKIRKLKSSEKFWGLSEVIKTRDKVSEMREYHAEFKQVLGEYSRDDITNNNAFTMQKHAIVDNIATDDEFVINVHDYSGLQTEINRNTYENHSVCLLLSSN